MNPEKNISVEDILDIVAPVLASIEEHYWAGFRHASPEDAFLVYFERELIHRRRDGTLTAAGYDELVEWYKAFFQHLWFWWREADESIVTSLEEAENVERCDSSDYQFLDLLAHSLSSAVWHIRQGVDHSPLSMLNSYFHNHLKYRLDAGLLSREVYEEVREWFNEDLRERLKTMDSDTRA